MKKKADLATVTLADVRKAREALRGVIHETPFRLSATISRLTGCEVFLKAENLQKTGSFKIRGAYNKVRLLSPADRERGVIAASAGNHAQGVAFAAAQAGINATVVMPEGASVSKVMATKGYGARVVLAGDTYDAAYRRALEFKQATGAVLIHAFDDPEVVAGQGTIGLEMMDGEPGIDTVVVPVGGGGLISGIALTIKEKYPGVRVIGVQAAGAPAMVTSFASGGIVEIPGVNTIADGIAVKRPGSLTFKLVQRYVDEMITVPDEDIASAILILLERSKTVVEGAGAITVAAILSGRVKQPGKRVAAVVSGGNVDMHMISQIIEHGLAKAGRLVSLRTVLVDRPGALGRFLGLIASTHANVISIAHDRINPTVPVCQAEVIVALETRDSEHIAHVIALLRQEGYLVSQT